MRRKRLREKREAKRLEDEQRLERQQNQQLHYALMNKLVNPQSTSTPHDYVLPAALKPNFDSPPPLPTEMSDMPVWYVVVAGKKLGPLQDESLINLAKNKRIGPNTMVWRKGNPKWTTLRSEKNLMALLSHLLS